ncbi:MAG: hypothetical protein O2954_10470 [bacterium]|nr:hypothetical protein [bacterium]
MDWLKEIEKLSPRQRAVQHEPETPRYAHARGKLRYLIASGRYLGERRVENRRWEIEIAVWAPPERKRNPGYYGCFRIYFKGNEVIFAVLFCFYDGTEGSPGFRSLESARAYARSEGFTGEENEDLN